jgi:nitrogenase-stabilizing/protective protein
MQWKTELGRNVMKILDQLRTLSSAEDFFRVLEVPYDPTVLDVARLHILKRMGQYLRKNAAADADEQTARSLCREQLERAYSDFVESTPLEQRVFKVLQDAVAPAAMPLVQISLSPETKG